MFNTQLQNPLRTLLILLAFTLVACSGGLDLFNPNNLGEMNVQLNVSGTPEAGGFVVQWRHIDTGRIGRAPVNLDLQPKNFSQLPIGVVRVSLLDLPTNCFAKHSNTRQVTIRSLRTTDVEFEITCR